MGNGRKKRWAAFLAAACVFAILPSWLAARTVNLQEARRAAVRLLEMENSLPELRLTPGSFALQGIEPLLLRGRQVAFLARLAPSGLMVLADITEVTPQVFISFSGDIETLRLNPYFSLILDRLEYDKTRLRYLAPDVPAAEERGDLEMPDAGQVLRNEEAWAKLLSDRTLPFAAALSASSTVSGEVAPLLTTAWDQDAPYWNDTPRVGGQATYTGCSATAMAQVMYYWQHPDRGQGSHSYSWGGQTLSADFDHPYDWDVMLESYDNGYTAAEADAVAGLMSDVGISINMNYGVTGSGAYPNDNNAFPVFFKYSPDAHDVYRSSLSGWETYFNLIRGQLDVHQPVILAIYTPTSGHAVVADGYRTTPSNQVHVNMGWSGAHDAYYALNNIYGYGNAAWDYAVVDIHPAQFKLTIKAAPGGTTDPSPGAYRYDYGTSRVVRVTALPEMHYRFTGWSGHASGTNPVVDIVADMEKTIRAGFERIIYAPLNAAGVRESNRSFSQVEQVNVLTFEGHPDNIDIMGYRIYLVESGQRTQLAFLTGGPGSFQYLHRGVSPSADYTYHIIAINFDYREGDPAVIEIR
ncbi:MAG: C10 family peptidase [Candidatus Aminicenantes bacterium]|nr:C10 family peptidase [Candidatus Aminicenantes bacterium]